MPAPLTIRRSFVAIFALITFTPIVAGQAAEWPMFGGTPQRNMVNLREKNLPVEWDIDKKKNIKWVERLGSATFGGPAIVDGRIFVGTNNQNPRDKKWTGLNIRVDPNNKVVLDKGPIDLGVLMCFNEKDGKFLWQAVHEKLPGGQVVDWPRIGLGSTPVVENGRLYYVSNRCELVCADVKNGQEIWRHDMIGWLGVFPHNKSICSPMIVGDNVYVVTSNGVNEDHINVPAPKAPSFVAINKHKGHVVWQDNSPTVSLTKFQLGKPLPKGTFRMLVNLGELVMHGQWSSPAHAVVNGESQIIFPGGDGWIYSFDEAGKLLWKFDCNPKIAQFNLLGKGDRSDFMATPVIYKNRVYIGVGQDPEHKVGVGHLWCIDMTKRGDVSPELRGPGGIVANPNSAAVWHYGGKIANPVIEKKLRRNHYFGRTMSTCAIHDGLVYAAELSGILHCLDAETGKPQWEFDTRAEIWSSPYWADGKIYLGTDSKNMFVFEHGRKLKVLAENDFDGRIRTTPVAHNGVLYVATENKFYAIAAP